MAFQGDSIFWVEVEKIVPNPYQPRREFDESKLKDLAESIRMYGILQPLTVTRKEIQRDDGAFFTEYELIAGERRLRASKLAGLVQIPVIIRDSDDTEQEKLELAIIENLQREDLNAVDRAMAFQQLADTFGMTHAEVAKKVGRSRMYVSNTIRLLGLPDYMLESLKIADISEGHARTLLMLNDRPEEQDVVYREILLKKLSVREVERIVRKIATDKVRKKTWKGTDPHLMEIEKEFTDVLGTRVFINKTDYGGKVTIDYFSESDLQKLLTLVRQNPETDDETKVGEAPVIQSMAAFAAATALEPSEPIEETKSEKSEFESEPETAIEPPSATQSEPEPEPEPKLEAEAEVESAIESAVHPEEPVPTTTVEPITTEPHVEVEVAESLTEVSPTPAAEAMDAEEARSDAVEDYVLEKANDAGAEVFRPTPVEQVVISADLQQQMNEQIIELKEHETNPTPLVNPQSEGSEKKADDSDLYSMKDFSL